MDVRRHLRAVGVERAALSEAFLVACVEKGSRRQPLEVKDGAGVDVGAGHGKVISGADGGQPLPVERHSPGRVDLVAVVSALGVSLETAVYQQGVVAEGSREIQLEVAPPGVAVVEVLERRVLVSHLQALAPAGVDVALALAGLVVVDEGVFHDLQEDVSPFPIRVFVFPGGCDEEGVPLDEGAFVEIGDLEVVDGLKLVLHDRGQLADAVAAAQVERQLCGGCSFRVAGVVHGHDGVLASCGHVPGLVVDVRDGGVVFSAREFQFHGRPPSPVCHFGLPVAVLVSLASHEPCREVERAQFVLRADGQSQVDVRLFGVGEYGPPAVDVEKVGGLVVYVGIFQLVYADCAVDGFAVYFFGGDCVVIGCEA